VKRIILLPDGAGSTQNYLAAISTALWLAGCAALTPNAAVDPPNDPIPDRPSTPVVWRVSSDCMAGAAPWQDLTGRTREALAESCRRRTGQASPGSGPSRDLVTLSLSGGGTKAAAFAAESMFYLDAIGLLPKASVISSVSGGSFAAAYYALSCGAADLACQAQTQSGLVRPVWRYGEAMQVLESGFWPMLVRAGIDFLIPGVKTPVAPETFAAFIDKNYLRKADTSGPAARFGDLNPRRPLLVLNSTILSGGRALTETTRGQGFLRRRTADEFLHFAFTDYYFHRIGSDLAAMPLGYGVASSAAFPALIGYPALRNYHCNADGQAGMDCVDDPRSMLTLTDGGANDNQGLVEVFAIMAELASGEARSDLSRAGHVSPRLEPMQPGDHALLLVLNSSLTEATGVDQPGDKDFLLGTISRASAAVDAYSAVAFSLRKQLYSAALDQLQKNHPALSMRAVEIGLTMLNRYQDGGEELATMADAGLDPAAALQSARGVRPGQQEDQRRAFAQLSQPAIRQALKLSAIHPQCLFEQSKLVETSLTGLARLTPQGAICLRHAARWSTALRAEELCHDGSALADEAALRCTDGHLRPLGPEALGPLPECAFTADSAVEVADILTSLRRNTSFMADAAQRQNGTGLPEGQDIAALDHLCHLPAP
jgi:hypothetical protein